MSVAETSGQTSFENILFEKKDAIAYITLNRPKVLNALNAATVAELTAAFENVRNDDSIKGAVITGGGDKAFIAGADISEIAKISPVEAMQMTRAGQTLGSLIEGLGKPVIAAVNGLALGGGCETAMACTIRIASEHAKFGQPEVKLGVIPGFGGTQRLPRLIGKGRALQLILSGAMIDANEAYRVGLVNEVVPAADLISRAEAILHQMLVNAPLALKYAMEAVNAGYESGQAEGLQLESTLFAVCTSTADKAEGTSAFLQKRSPNFQGQ